MRELRDGLRFPLEAPAAVLRGREPVRKNLDGDGSIEPGVARPIDLAHAARAIGARIS